MSFTPPLHRVLHTAILCGVVGSVLTWFVHLFLKAFLRAASPLVIEGTVATLCGGVLATVLGLYFSRTIKHPFLRSLLCFVVVVLIPIVVAAEGISGIMSVGYLTKVSGGWLKLRANQDHRIAEWGYSLMPPIWTTILCWVICWYYKARQGVSLLKFDRAASPRSADGQSSLNRELRLVLRCLVASGLLSWLVHHLVASRLGWIWGSQSSVEGAMVVLSSIWIAAVGALYLSRIVTHRFARESLCVSMALVVGVAFGLSGEFGYQTAIFLMRLVNGGYRNEIVIYGYYVFPPIWSGMLSWGICWYYKATHGGASLLNFDSPDRYYVEPPLEQSV